MAKIVSIEGNIGVGKSTFIDIVRRNIPDSESVGEPVDIWLNIRDSENLNILQAFYNDKKRWSYTFQNLAFMTRMMSIQNKINTTTKSIIFLDRSLDTDKNVFAKMLKDEDLLSELEWEIYKCCSCVYETSPEKMTKKNIIYLRCSPEIAYERIIKRGRIEEQHISFEYIKSVHKYHEEWLLNNRHNNVLILDCDKDFENDEDNQMQLMKIVLKFIGSID
jgi:deoxynucleoside kinase